MMCKPSLVVPAQYLGLHSRGKRGRPRSGDQGAKDEEGETAGCR